MDPLVRDTLWAATTVLFSLALVHKLRDWAGFRRALADYGIVPSSLVPAVAVAVAGLEAAVVFGRLPALGGLLLLAYAGAIAANLARGRDRIDCGCGGVAGRERLSWWLVGRNVVCAAGAFGASSRVGLRDLEWLDVFSVLAAVAVLSALYAAADQLIANAARMREAT
jgi:methylamine utilization protein MauE